MPRLASVLASRLLPFALAAAPLGCADEFGVPGEDDDELPLMRSLDPQEFQRSVRLELRAADGWVPTGIVPPAGTPVRVWVDGASAHVERRGGPLAPTRPPGAVLVRQGHRVWSAERGLAWYAPDDEELWIGLNAEPGDLGGPVAEAPVAITVAWGQPAVPHAPGLELLAVAGSSAALEPWLLPADGAFVTVGRYDPGARLRVVAERVGDEVTPGLVDGGPGSEPGPDPGPMARLLPGEATPALRFPGLWSEGIAYRIDGELGGELPLGGVVHLPDGGELSLAANGGTQPGAQAGAGLAVGLEPVPRLGVELSTLPWSAFADAVTAVEATVDGAWVDTGIAVARGDLLRVEGHGVWRGVPKDPRSAPVAADGGVAAVQDVDPAGLLVRAPAGADWLVPGSRILAPHVRIDDHVMAVPSRGVLVVPADGMLQVGANGCVPGGAGDCAQALADTVGSVSFEVGWRRAATATELD